jgi:prepilin-type N-terminal cleavage/methylation domain-containing protein
MDSLSSVFFTFRSAKKGFTLSEMLVVVTLIAIIALIAIFSFQGQLAKGRDIQRKTDLSRFKAGLEEYYNDNGAYPSETDWDKMDCNADGSAVYTEKFKCDPSTKQKYLYLTTLPYTGERSEVSGTYYCLYAALENPKDPDITGIGCGSLGCGYDIPEEYNINFGVCSGGTSPKEAGFIANPPVAPTMNVGGSIPAGTIYPTGTGGEWACNNIGICNAYGTQENMDCWGCLQQYRYRTREECKKFQDAGPWDPNQYMNVCVMELRCSGACINY